MIPGRLNERYPQPSLGDPPRFSYSAPRRSLTQEPLLVLGATSGQLQCLAPAEVVADLSATVDCEELGDVEFTFDEGPPLFANRALLAVRCDHFRQLFYGSGASMQDGRSRSVAIRDCPRDAFRAFLQLLCTGAVDMLDELMLVEVHRLLDLYNMQRLSQALRDKIVGIVTEATVLRSVEAAHHRGQTALRDDLINKIVTTGMAGVIHHAATDSLPRELLLEITRRSLPARAKLQSDGLVMASSGPLRIITERRVDGTSPNEQAQQLGLFGDMTGWSVGMLSVPNPQKFTVTGVSASENYQIYLWLWRLEYNEDGTPRLPESPSEFPQGTGPFGNRSNLQLTFVGGSADKGPRAEMRVDGEEVKTQEFPDDGVEYRPVLIVGDRDGLSYLTVD